jgi:hypothetical protein
VIVTDSNGQPVGGNWPPLIEQSIWYAAQDVLNAPGRAPGAKSVRKHLLTSVMRCGKCNVGHLRGVWVMTNSKGVAGHEITYACADCRGCAIRANDVEPLLYKIIGDRLSRPDAVDILKNAAHDSAEAERLRVEKIALLRSIETANQEYEDDVINGARLQGRIKRATEKMAELDRQGQDQDRRRVLKGLHLGTPQVVDEVRELSPDRFRAVVDLLLTITIAPVGRGAHNRVFNPARVEDGVAWKV